jgi:chromosome segregation ATPase
MSKIDEVIELLQDSKYIEEDGTKSTCPPFREDIIKARTLLASIQQEMEEKGRQIEKLNASIVTMRNKIKEIAEINSQQLVKINSQDGQIASQQATIEKLAKLLNKTVGYIGFNYSGDFQYSVLNQDIEAALASIKEGK